MAFKCSLGPSCFLVHGLPCQDWTEDREMLPPKLPLSLCLLIPPMVLDETLSQLLPPEELFGVRNSSCPEASAACKRKRIPVVWNCSEGY